MAKNDFQYGKWNSYTLQCGTIILHWFRQVTAPCNVACGSKSWQWIHQVAAPCNVTRRSGIMTLNARWQHPAVWQVALGWHAIEFAQTSAILEFYIWLRFRPHHRMHWPQSTGHSAPVSEILAKSDHARQKKMMSYRFSRWRISAILNFRDPIIMGSLKSPGTTSYRSSIDTIALNCLLFGKIAFLHFGVKIQDGGSLPSWILGVQ